MPKMFKIHEDDLAELERAVPALAEALVPHLNPALKVKVRRVKTILSNVRWDYGPPDEVEAAPADDDHCS